MAPKDYVFRLRTMASRIDVIKLKREAVNLAWLDVRECGAHNGGLLKERLLHMVSHATDV